MGEIRFGGIGVSQGIRIGKAFLYRSAPEASDRESIESGAIDQEIAHLQHAREASRQDLAKLIQRTEEALGPEKAAILSAQQAMLDDPAFYPEMENRIRQNQVSAEKAVKEVVEQFASLFEGMDNDYFRERATDVRDIGKRLLAHLRGKRQPELSEIDEECILVADDLTPSDTVQLDPKVILGFVTRIGGKTSHTAILSRSLGVAAVVGIGEYIEQIRHGDPLIIDGTTGLCILNPEPSTLEEYRKKMESEQAELHALREFAHKKAITRDGFEVEIAANIGTPAEAEPALQRGAEGVGLYRTEFLFMNSDHMPDEEEQLAAYRDVAAAFAERPVIIRTLDIGGDKELPYLNLPKEMNPFLGYRAIRLCLDRKEILVTQLRAILRASIHGNLKIMFPMISSIEEWREARKIYDEVREQLREEGTGFREDVEVGMMVEVPSAAVLADLFAKEVDFFSIGTNDLVQYTLAVDRMNEKVAHLYDYFHPAVIRLIKTVIDAAHKEGKWVGMCGGMAGDPLAAPLLLGLGLDEWSMDSGSIAKVKKVVSGLSRQECVKLADEVLSLGTAEEIRERMRKTLQEKGLL